MILIIIYFKALRGDGLYKPVFKNKIPHSFPVDDGVYNYSKSAVEQLCRAFHKIDIGPPV